MQAGKQKAGGHLWEERRQPGLKKRDGVLETDTQRGAEERQEGSGAKGTGTGKTDAARGKHEHVRLECGGQLLPAAGQ